MFDPEPDRDEAAQRDSHGWDVMAATAPLLDRLDAIIEAFPGCAQGLHDWHAEFAGDPVDTPDRNLAWHTTRVQCADCGQAASLVLDPPPAVPGPVDPATRRLVTCEDIRQALRDGEHGSTAVVQIGPLPASSLFTAVRLARGTRGVGPARATGDDVYAAVREHWHDLELPWPLERLRELLQLTDKLPGGTWQTVPADTRIADVRVTFGFIDDLAAENEHLRILVQSKCRHAFPHLGGPERVGDCRYCAMTFAEYEADQPETAWNAVTLASPVEDCDAG